MHTGKITDTIRECMRAAGVRKRPYVLRAYAETQLIIAESKGKISHPYLQFVAGIVLVLIGAALLLVTKYVRE